MISLLNEIYKRKLGTSIFWGLTVFFLGVLATALFTYQKSEHNKAVVREKLKLASEEVEQDLLVRLQFYENRLRGLRGVIHMVGIDAITRTLITRYSQARNVQQEYPGSRGFGLIRRVRPNELDAFLQAARNDGWPNFRLRQFQPHDGDYYIVQYIDPPGGNDQAVGFDIASEPRRKEAAIESMRTGVTTLSAPIDLISDQPVLSRSFLLLLPIYRILGTPETPSLREQDIIGWIHAPLVMGEVIAQLHLADRKLHVTLFDITDPQSTQLVYRTEGVRPDFNHLNTHIIEREFYGRLWRFEIDAYPELLASLEPVNTSSILIGGSFLSLMLGGLIGMLLLSRQRQQEISAGQARLATIVENSSDAIIGEALDGSIITWNRAAELMFGYAEAEVLGKPLAPLLVPDELFWEDEELLVRVARGERGPSMETRRIRKDGRLIDVAITCSFIRESNGTILGAAKLMHDIGDRKRAEKYLKEFNAALELQVSERTSELSRVAGLLQAVLDASSEVSVIATNKSGQVVVFNRGAELLLGYRAADVLMSKSPDHFHLHEEIESRRLELEEELGRKVSSAEVFYVKPDMGVAETRQWTYVRSDGSHVPVSLVVTAIRTAEGDLIGHLGMAEDITERLRISEELQAATSAAKTANAAKSLFLANMSHEIRTPMNAVIGVATLLQNTELNEHQRALLGKLQIAGKSLLGIINDILDIAKIEAGEMRLEQAPFSPRQLLFELKELFTAQAETKGLEFTVEGDGFLPDMVVGDSLRVNQILMNLVGNAIKFTATGSVKVIADYIKRDHTVDLKFRVRDTGCGINEDALKTLFSPFTQADASTTRRFGGTGLGLSVVRGLAEQMNGRVDATSQIGRGSEFCVQLPLQLFDHAKNSAAIPQNFHVMIVASPELGGAVSNCCNLLGWRAHHFASIEAVLQYLADESKKNDSTSDLLIMEAVPLLETAGNLFDYQQQILSLLKMPITPIFIDAEDYLASFVAPGLQKHVLQQSISPTALFNLASELFFERTGTTHKVMSSTKVDSSIAQWLHGFKLLVVDDSDLNLELASLLLQQQGAQVQMHCNGREAVNALLDSGNFFDAVLMDVQMPEMDGYEATRIIRQEMGMTRLPIIALTAGALPEEKKRAYSVGMTDFLTKPLDIAALICVVRRVVESERKMVLPIVDCEPHSHGHDLLPEVEGFSLVEALSRFNYDASLLWSSVNRLFDEFSDLINYPATVETSRHSPAMLAARFHKLRGSASLVGANELAALATKLETSLRDKKEASDEQDELLAQLPVIFAQLKTAALPYLPVGDAVPHSTVANIEDSTKSLHQLLGLLKQRDMRALDVFAAAEVAIEFIGGEQLVKHAWSAIDALQFDKAISLLGDAGFVLGDEELLGQ